MSSTNMYIQEHNVEEMGPRICYRVRATGERNEP